MRIRQLERKVPIRNQMPLINKRSKNRSIKKNKTLISNYESSKKNLGIIYDSVDDTDFKDPTFESGRVLYEESPVNKEISSFKKDTFKNIKISQESIILSSKENSNERISKPKVVLKSLKANKKLEGSSSNKSLLVDNVFNNFRYDDCIEK